MEKSEHESESLWNFRNHKKHCSVPTISNRLHNIMLNHHGLHISNIKHTSLSNSDGKPVSSNDVKGGGTSAP